MVREEIGKKMGENLGIGRGLPGRGKRTGD